ncbi:hypothetical protein [Mycolicibacterium sphagni]|uniref:hypothetical protein n=1 Tax=Mycolicibacterium sphagni TaxID=1786 RepID=UPI0021F37245|nr:hypothetical protein [Mycolicibacterium sphagni]MCV7174793.1 hypothetical protein [Mycolicibacterium sphagni]
MSEHRPHVLHTPRDNSTGEFFWELEASNGSIVCQSYGSFVTKLTARASARNLFGGIAVVWINSKGEKVRL